MKLILTLLSLFIFNGFVADTPELDGSWELKTGNQITSVLIQNGYITITDFTPDSFIHTRGGFLGMSGNKLTIKQEFNTAEKELKDESLEYHLANNTLDLAGQKFTRIDKGNAPLSGVWRITGRVQNGNMSKLHQTGTRKTLKMLTGTRFQWFAIDLDGNKFYGTGGGTYTFGDGKYVENIEYFSRDNSRVGASLSFDDHVEGTEWHHTGLSSQGAKIYEIWENAFTSD